MHRRVFGKPGFSTVILSAAHGLAGDAEILRFAQNDKQGAQNEKQGAQNDNFISNYLPTRGRSTNP